MTDNEIAPVIPEDIQTLLERRSTYQDWLGKLDDVSGDFRSEVAARVASDYEERLRSVEAELATHRSALENSLDGRRSAVDGLTRDHDARSAELEETELRHLVGEYTEDEYGARKEEHSGRIAELEDALRRETEAVDELQTVLSEIAGASLVAAVAEPDDAVELAADSADEERLEADEASGVEAELAAELDRLENEPDGTEVDEVSWGEPVDEDLSESVDRAVADADAAMAAVDEGVETMPVEIEETDAVEAVAEEQAAEGDDFLDELEFLESLSIDDPVEFDSVSRLLDDEESKSGEDKRSV